jgi:hypothetical protein
MKHNRNSMQQMRSLYVSAGVHSRSGLGDDANWSLSHATVGLQGVEFGGAPLAQVVVAG